MLSREDREIKHLKAKLARRDATILQLEAKNDALGARLHDRDSGKPAAASRTLKDRFWRRYVNGGSSIWRVLFEVCNGWGQIWQIVVRVGQKKHER